MQWEADEKEVKAAGAELLPDGRRGLRIHGWEIESTNRSCLTSLNLQSWEEKLETSHLPEMIFVGWKNEPLPPVEVPAAAQWKFRSKPFEQIILDYDYTFTTPYSGSETVETSGGVDSEGNNRYKWEDCEEQINVAALTSKEPILFYDEVVLYEDELADNGVSLLTVKVRVMPSYWFLLLRFWLRVDGVLMRLRDTRVVCNFSENTKPVILRDVSWREATFKALASKGYPSDSASYNDPNVISQRLPVVLHKTQKLKVPDSL
ncbi:putative TIP41-like protein [Helianthus annuus]|nr:putative TIP41-like protein [Helianthus annuus]KAJ0836183.1 putative TIP41-like protein [Helianthus annuus]